MREKSRGKRWLTFLKNKSICLSSITAFELFLGAELSAKNEKNVDAVKKIVQQYPVLQFDIKSSYIAGKISANLQKKGKIIELNDIYIAAIAVKNRIPVATDNVENFRRVTNLSLVEL